MKPSAKTFLRGRGAGSGGKGNLALLDSAWQLLPLAVFGSVLSAATLPGAEADGLPAAHVTAFANAPLYFEANRGQAEDAVRFIARGRDCNLLLAPTEAVLVLGKFAGDAGPPLAGGARRERETLESRSVRLRLAGANPQARMTGLEELPGKANYFIGNDPAGWRAGIPLFSGVQVDEPYPGVALVYYADRSAQLEYDFRLQPGAAPERIALRVEGADQVRVDAEGNLVLKIGGDEVRQHQPFLYQMTGGARKQIAGGYRLKDPRTAGFWVGEYDRHLPLIIDPVLDFGAYVGGTKGEDGWAVALDGSGNVFICGDTFSPSIATTNAADPTYSGTDGTKQYGDAFVAKFANTSNVWSLAYLTYLGGKGQDSAIGLAVDPAGYAYVTGFTDSTNFPITNIFSPTPLQPKIAGTNNNFQGIYPIDAFVAKLDTNGSRLIWSTYLGGDGRDEGTAIAVDTNTLSVFVTGYTESTNFPVMLAPYHYYTNFGGVQDAFVAEIGPYGTNLVYCTYLGGTNQDVGQGIALDASGCAYVTGYTFSTNFPTFPTNNSYFNGETNKISIFADAFFTVLSTNGTPFYSTYLGGEDNDVGLRVAVDASSNAFMTGYTFSTNFPVTVAIANARAWTNPRTNNFSDVFVTKFSPTNSGGTNLYYTNYSVVFGGSQTDEGVGIAVDALGDAYITGFTSSTNLFGSNIFSDLRSVLLKKKPATNNVFLAVLNPNATAFRYAAELGGSGNDTAYGVAVDPAGNAYLVGATTSTNLFPTNSFPQTQFNGGTNDVFVAVISMEAAPLLSIGRQAGGNVELSWRALAPPFALESNTNLTSPGTWIAVATNTPATNGWHTVVLPATNSGSFFRLRSD